MLSVHQIALRLVKYIGLTSLDPADPTNSPLPAAEDGGTFRAGLVPNDLGDVVAAINGALQEMWEEAPTAMRYQRMGTFLRGPTSLSLDLTQYSKAVVIPGFEPWMIGCSLRIGGEALENEIRSETELAREYLGGTATGVPAVVFHDCITPPAEVREIVDPVEIPQTRRLTPAGSREEFYGYDQATVGGDDYGQVWVKLQGQAKFPAQPWAYFVDTDYQDGAKIRLRVAPLPDGDYPIQYGARLRAPVVTEEDVWVCGGPVPERYLPIPNGWDEAVLLPMALQRFSAHPFFGSGNPLAAPEMARQYSRALKMVRGVSPSRSSTRLSTRFR